KVSLVSADTWVVAAIWVRNTALNQAILFGILMAVLVLARLLGALVPQSGLPAWEWTVTSLWMPVLAFLTLSVATIFIGINLKQAKNDGASGEAEWYTKQEWIQALI